MRYLIIVLLLAAAVDAGAKPHSVEVRVSDGKAVYLRTLSVETGKQTDYVGPVSSFGAPGRMLLANVLLNEDKGFGLQYQVELSGGKGSSDPVIQGQGEVSIRSGKSARVIECGVWTVEVSLDGTGTLGKKNKAKEWNPGGSDNYRLTATVRGFNGRVCRQIGRNRTQGNVVDGSVSGDRKFGFLMNSIVASGAGSGPVNLQYQVEQSLADGSEGFQLQGENTVIPGVKLPLKSGSRIIDLLVESGK